MRRRTISSNGKASVQAAVISLVAAVVTLLALTDSTEPSVEIGAVALAHLVLAGISWRLPVLDTEGVGERWRVAIGLTMLALLGLTAWVSEGYASGVGPVFVLVFVWWGLHCRPRTLVLAVPVASAGYLLGLLAGNATTRQLVSTLVLIPIATVVALLIADYVGSQQRLRHELESRERWRAALMATLAHDVRSPLSTVTGTLEILQDDIDTDGRYGALLASAVRQSGRVLKLATGLLEMERVEHGQLLLDRRSVDLRELAEQVVALSQPGAVRVDVEPGTRVHADGERLEQVIYNLVINALRHGRPPVVISARTLPSGLEIAVQDHGDGVPQDDLPFLFERFSTADRAPNSVGLGLWIVRTLVEAHGGTVHYEQPRGARFVVTLPSAGLTQAPGGSVAQPLS